MNKVYEYSHIVGFEETNLVGNVYYANFVLWQGRCREMFLYDNAPDVIEQITQGLALVTVQVSCQFLSELFAFDRVTITMCLKEIVQNRITTYKKRLQCNHVPSIITHNKPSVIHFTFFSDNPIFRILLFRIDRLGV